MKSRKGEYYIVCHKNDEMYLHKKRGTSSTMGKTNTGCAAGRMGCTGSPIWKQGPF